MYSQYMWLYRPEKTGLIYTKYKCLYYGTYILFCLSYVKSVSFSEFLMDFHTPNKILNAICITNEKLLHFKLWKLGHILRVDKTGFSGLFTYYISCMWMDFVKPNILSHKAYCILLLQLITAYSHALLMHSAITGLSCLVCFSRTNFTNTVKSQPRQWVL